MVVSFSVFECLIKFFFLILGTSADFSGLNTVVLSMDAWDCRVEDGSIYSHGFVKLSA